MSPRPALEHIRRPQILEAASQTITERGLAATRIADVAERVGTSGPSLLYWFSSKDELLSEALRYGEETFYGGMTAILANYETPAERLRALVESALADYDWTLWMELWTRALRDEGTAETRLHLDRRWRGAIEREIREGQARGDFSDEHAAEHAAAILACLLDGLAVQGTLDDPDFPAERIRDIVLEMAEALLGAPLPELPDLDLSPLSANGKGAVAREGER